MKLLPSRVSLILIALFGANLPAFADETAPADSLLGAMYAANRGDNEQARQIITRMISKDPQNPDLYMNRTAVLLQLNDEKSALTDIEKTFELLKDQRKISSGALSQAHFNRACVYVRLGREKEALADLLAAVNIDPRNDGAYLELGSYYTRHGDQSKAQEYYGIAERLQKTAQSTPGQINKKLSGTAGQSNSDAKQP